MSVNSVKSAQPARPYRTLSERFPGLPQWVIRACNDDALFALAVLITAVVAFLGVVGNQDPANDVASCYARQVREFAAGNWEGAFFHMTPPLAIVLAGLLAKFLWLPPFAALKMVSGGLFVGCLWPLHQLLRRRLSEEDARLGCLVFLFSGRLMRYATMGLLDSPKAFLLLLLAWLVCRYAEKPDYRRAVEVGLALAGLSLVRGEGVFFVPLGLAAVVFLPWLWGTVRMNRTSWVRTMFHVFLVGLVILAVTLPQLLYIRHTTGYLGLDSRQAWRFRTCLEHVGIGSSGSSLSLEPPLPENATPITPPAEDRGGWGRNARETVKGLDPTYLLLCGIAFGVLYRRRGFTRLDLVLAAPVLYNLALFTANGFITKRYIACTAPFLVPWATIGLRRLAGISWFREHHWLQVSVMVILVGIGISGGTAKIRHLEVPHEKRVGEWLRAHRTKCCSSSSHRLYSHPAWNDYHDGRLPVILAVSPQYAYWGEADWVRINGHFQFPPDAVIRLFTEWNADVLVEDDVLRRISPGISTLLAEKLPLLEDLSESTGCLLYGRGTAGSAIQENDVSGMKNQLP